MMIHAYPEIYLNSAQAALGDTFDYAINAYGMSGSDFVNIFTVSHISKKLENGEPSYLSGKSGIEIASEIIETAYGKEVTIEPTFNISRTKEYWIGWAVCYYQWYSCQKYNTIFKVVSYEDLEKMYYTLHESDVSKFVDIVDSKIRIQYPDTNLKRIRTLYGLSQAELAKQSGIGLRSIQMYEQRNKNINKASAETIYKISKTLGCTMEELIEKQPE